VHEVGEIPPWQVTIRKSAHIVCEQNYDIFKGYFFLFFESKILNTLTAVYATCCTPINPHSFKSINEIYATCCTWASSRLPAHCTALTNIVFAKELHPHDGEDEDDNAQHKG
jgi:hypothetical protein